MIANGSAKMVIYANSDVKVNGQLGIGNAPLANSKLDVVNVAAAGGEATGVGAIRIQDYNVNVRNNAHGGLEFKQASNQGYKLGTNAGDNTFSFLTRSSSASWSETMTLKQDKVGIGTSSPEDILHVIRGTNGEHIFGQYYIHNRAEPAMITIGRQGGTIASPAIIASSGSGSGTKLGEYGFRAYSTGGGGPAWHNAANISCVTDKNFNTNE